MTKCIDRDCPSADQCLRRHFDKEVMALARVPYADFNRPEGKDRCEDGYWPDSGKQP